MRSLIIGAAALLAVAAPGVAAAQTGYVGASYNQSEVDLGGPSSDFDGFAIDGVVAFDANALGVQLGARYANFEADGGGDLDGYGLDGHVFSRNGQWQLGVGAGYTNLDSGTGDTDEWALALEGLYFMDRTTLGAALSYGQSDGLGSDLDTLALDVEARYFIADNFRIDGTVGFGQVDAGGGNDGDLTSLGVGAEYQLASHPISFFGSYTNSNLDVGAGDLDTDSFAIGARWNFGGQTLMDRDRSGANNRSVRGGLSRLFGL
jgi:hypothetical protein